MTQEELLESRYRMACGYHPMELQLFWDTAQAALKRTTVGVIRTTWAGSPPRPIWREILQPDGTIGELPVPPIEPVK